MKLTGKTRYRSGWGGKLILQLEYEYRYVPAGCRPNLNSIPSRCDWRDANVSDYLNGAVPEAPALTRVHSEK